MLPYCLERGLYLFAVYLLCIMPSEAKRINITAAGLYDTDLSPDGAVIGERFYAAPESLPESLYLIHVKISAETLDTFKHVWRAEDLLNSNVTVEEKKRPERIRSRRSTDNKFTPWTTFGCCNKVTKTQTRERKNSRELTIETRFCNWNFCTECKDTWKDCKKLKDFGACHGNSDYQSYMATNCMQTCQLCVSPSKPTLTTAAATTKKPSVKASTKPKTTKTPPRINRRSPGSKKSQGKRADSLVRVGVFSAYYKGNLYYQYTMLDSTPKGRYPIKWQSANVNNKDDISDFFLSSKKSKQYSAAVYFCKSRFGTMEKFLVRQTPCHGGWLNAFTLYSSVQPNALSRPLKVAATGRNPWMSRIYQSKSCCGYQTKTWTFHALKLPEPQTVQPSPASNVQLPSVKLNNVEKSCLDQHNFFRAFHGAPPLRWDPELAKSANLWANYLNNATESTPHVLISQKYQKTPQWPHSIRGTKYRAERSGENIAWELSSEMGSADDFVMHWYAEIFDYDRNNIFAKTKNRPIGHFTQLVWKETRSLGCALRKKKIDYQGREYEVGYVVAHYSPGGNVHSSSHDRTNRFYQHNVNQLMTGTCRSPQHCGMHDKNGCLGFDPSFTCGCNKVKGLSTPKCVGKKGGCVVKCNAANPNNWKPWTSACKGKTMCRCDPDRGAICR